ncbi:MAG: NrsF family protein [Acidobacteria bacterium]|nr:NrsF family protein [Acidobacteriota bacterium]
MTSHTAELAASLSADLSPVTPLPLPGAQLRRWGVIGGAALVATIVMGVRHDWAAAIVSWPVIGHTAVLAAVAGSGAWAAIRLATPGEALPRAAGWPVAFGVIWLVWMAVDAGLAGASGTLSQAGFGWRCIVRAVLGAAVPGVVLLVMVRRAMPLMARPAAVALAASTAAIGGLAAEWMCPNMAAMHMLVWHAAPVLVVVVAATMCGTALVGHFSSTRNARLGHT